MKSKEPLDGEKPVKANGTHPLLTMILFVGVITGLVTLGSHLSKKNEGRSDGEVVMGEVVSHFFPASR